MRVLKNLLGDGSKIHVDEVVMKQFGLMKLLSEAVIVEEGTNVNGDYIRFGNGWQICLCSVESTKTHAIDISGPFPASFVNDKVGISVSSGSASFRSISDVSLVGAGVSPSRVYRLMKNSQLAWDFPEEYLSLYLIAIGRWK